MGDEIRRQLEALQARLDQAKRERADPVLLLDRIERRLRTLHTELESRPSYKWRKEVPGGWVSRAAEIYLSEARRALAEKKPEAAAVAMFFLGQEMMKLEEPIVERTGQVRKRQNTEARWKQPVRLLVRRVGRRLDDVLNAIEDAVDQPDDDGFEFVSVNRHERTVNYRLPSGAYRDITFATLADFLSRPKKNNLR